MRCQYCYNPEIVLGKGKITLADAILFLKSRKGFLEGVVLSGGECTMYKGIISWIREVKELGFSIKIDTNGSRPDILRTLCKEGLVDYIALDYKAMPSTFQFVTGSDLFNEFEESLELLISGSIDFEVRTTVHSELISKEELHQMAHYLISKGYRGKYFIQYYVDDKPSLVDLSRTERYYSLEGFDSEQLQFVVRN